MRAHRPTRVVLALALVLGLSMAGCGDNEYVPAVDERALVDTALNAFVADLIQKPITGNDDLVMRLRSYLEANPGFYGSTVALIGNDGLVTSSPYVYRGAKGLVEKDLAFMAYEINQQEWLAVPRDTKQAVWSDPYFDAGGGEIWMVTRSVPIVQNGAVTAVATTDLPVDAPQD